MIIGPCARQPARDTLSISSSLTLLVLQIQKKKFLAAFKIFQIEKTYFSRVRAAFSSFFDTSRSFSVSESYFLILVLPVKSLLS